MQISIPILDHT